MTHNYFLDDSNNDLIPSELRLKEEFTSGQKRDVSPSKVVSSYRKRRIEEYSLENSRNKLFFKEGLKAVDPSFDEEEESTKVANTKPVWLQKTHQTLPVNKFDALNDFDKELRSRENIIEVF